MNDDALLAKLRERQPPFSRKLGVRFIEAGPDRVVSEMTIEADMCASPDRGHGGAIMSQADMTGAMSTVINLPDGMMTTTIESKTNFFAAVPEGEVTVAETTPLHKGRSTMVWQTRITRKSDGRLAALVTQTQIILPK